MDLAKPKMQKPDGGALKKLIAACKNYDMDGVDEIMAEILIFRYESDGGLAEWIAGNVKQMNFKEIVEKLSAMDL